MLDSIEKYFNLAILQVKNCKTPQELNTLKLSFFSKSGQLSKITTDLKNLDPKEKASIGKFVNLGKEKLNQEIASKEETLLQENKEQIDTSIPGNKIEIAPNHILTSTINEITEIFSFLGFTRKRYPEVDTDYYAFEALNMPANHPARDEWETFFIKQGKNLVLTPHTSNCQVRELEKGEFPVRLLNIAKCYRRQEDVSHTQMFHQFEGLVVDKDISIKNLIGTLDFFVINFFGKERKTRLRPYHFQFTEPSFEVDINCSVCLGKGCAVCKEGWLELGGAGMLHPKVLENGKVPSNLNGFAFGWGVERVAMMKYNIPDCRYFYKNDLRFLQQFENL